MRPQVAPLIDYRSATPYALDEDLGWNDLSCNNIGEPNGEPAPPAGVVPMPNREAVALSKPDVPAADPAPVKRAAFTLRIDSERHFKLRHACLLQQRSAQQLPTEALDSLLMQMPELQPTAGKAGKRC